MKRAAEPAFRVNLPGDDITARVARAMERAARRAAGGPTKPHADRKGRRVDVRVHGDSSLALERLEARYGQDATSIIRWALIVVEWSQLPREQQGPCPTCHELPKRAELAQKKKGKRQ